MFLTENERAARDSGKIVASIGNSGVSSLCGPIVSVGVVLDYTNIPQKIINKVADQSPLSKEDIEDIRSAVKAIGSYTISCTKLLEILDIDVSAAMSDYNALMGLIFDVFKVFGNDPDIVQSVSKIKEVIKNEDLSIYQDKKRKSKYITRQDWTQFNNLIPNTKFTKCSPETFGIMFASELANIIRNKELAAAKEKYPEYDFDNPLDTEEKVKFLQENGMTEYHRAFLPEFSGFAFSKRILI